MVTVETNAKVADFGTARKDNRDPHVGIAQTEGYQADAKTHATTGNVVGTGPYMPPECEFVICALKIVTAIIFTSLPSSLAYAT